MASYKAYISVRGFEFVLTDEELEHILRAAKDNIVVPKNMKSSLEGRSKTTCTTILHEVFDVD